MNTYAKRFLVSFVAGVGSALGASMIKTCMRLAENKLNQINTKKKAEIKQEAIIEKGEES